MIPVTRGLLALVLVLVAVAALISYSGSDDRGSSSEVIVDEANGEIFLPLDRFMATHDEFEEIQSAQNLFMLNCFSSLGYAVEPFQKSKIGEFPERRYGLWQQGLAQQDGYGLPASLEANSANTTEPSTQFTESDTTYCATLLAKEAFGGEPEVMAQQAAFEIFGLFIESDDARKLIEQWRQCLDIAGVATYPGRDGLYSLPGTVDTSSPESIRIATEDVKCKKSTNLVRRMAELEASAQAQYIDGNQSNLIASRGLIDEQVLASRNFLKSQNVLQ